MDKITIYPNEQIYTDAQQHKTSVQQLLQHKHKEQIKKATIIPSDTIYGGYKSETSVLRLSLMIRLKHMHAIVYCSGTLIWQQYRQN